MNNLVNSMIRKQHYTRMALNNRNLRSVDFNDISGNGNGEKYEYSRRGRQKNGAKRNSVGARMSKDGTPTAYSDSRVKNSFGPPIPDDILDDLCFRFLINIPDDQKNAPVRLCFQIELAHWFYIDFYCKGNNANVKCPEVTMRDLVGQIFSHCDFLMQYTDNVDKVIEEWRIYKSGVPTYGAALLDSSLNYVLLVQGYFAKNSWGFPKGKVNEDEEAMACASREVMEEVGFDISDKISKKRLIQCFVNDTLIRLYIIRDVPIDFPFAPNTRCEIGKIQWFCIWDLPKDRSDTAACERIGMSPSSFYTVIPFVKELQAYVAKYHSTHNKPKLKSMDAINISTRSSSAFSPVQPQQKSETLASALSPLFNTRAAPNISHSAVSQHSSQHASPNSAFFKPLMSTPQQVSYTGTAFVQMLSRASCTNIEDYANSLDEVKMREVTRPVPAVPKAVIPVLGRPVYDAFRKEAEMKTCSREPSQKTSLNNFVYHGFTETKGRSSTDNSKKRTNVECGHCCSLSMKSDISPVPLHPRGGMMKHYLKGTIGPMKSPKVLMTHHMNEDRPFVSLCEAWKNFKAFIAQLLSRLHIEALLHGNITKQAALGIMQMVEDTLIEHAHTKPLLPSQLVRYREVQLPDRGWFVYQQRNEVHNNCGIEIYYQTDMQSTSENMFLELFCQIISEPCFNTLRTQEQLGYIVFSGPRRANGIQGLRFIIQSEKPPHYLESRVEAFLKTMEKCIEDMTEEAFQKHIQALAIRRLDKPKKLSAECAKYWGEIISQQYNFDRDNIEVAYLKTLTKDDIIQFYKVLLAIDAPRRHKVSVHVLAREMDSCPVVGEFPCQNDVNLAPAPPLPQPSVIENMTEFKRSLPLFPLVKPHINFMAAKL